MTPTPHGQVPEALRIADEFKLCNEYDSIPSMNDIAKAEAELRRLHTENTTLQQGYDAARMEIDGLRDRVQELGAMLRENRNRRIVELEAQLEAIDAGGVETLRRRECLHQISEPAPAAVAGPSELPTVPDSVLVYVQAYGDSRADDDGRSGLRIGELILALRRWAKSIAAAPTTQAAPAAQGDALPWLQANDMAALERFAETTDDDESYDIGKEAVQRLAGFGCLRSHGFGKYSITDFGHYVLNDWSLARELPFKSQSERDAARSQAKEGA